MHCQVFCIVLQCFLVLGIDDKNLVELESPVCPRVRWDPKCSKSALTVLKLNIAPKNTMAMIVGRLPRDPITLLRMGAWNLKYFAFRR